MIRRLAVGLLTAPPVHGLLRRRALRDRPLTVLCYHTLGPDSGGIDGWTVLREADFRAQIAFLRSRYEIVDLDTALDAGPGGDRPRAVLTFDDGDRGLHAHLRPILLETGLPVTIYVATAQFETGRPFWFDRVVNALQGSGEIRVPGLGSWTLPAAGGKPRWEVIRRILAALKAVPEAGREALADAVVAAGSPCRGPGLGPMGLDALREMAAIPGVTIGAHSHGHELLDRIPLADARRSIDRSRALLRDWTGREIRHFAFPNGNHDPALCAAARALGLASAAILGERLAAPGTDPFMLPRISVGRYDGPQRFRLRLVGL